MYNTEVLAEFVGKTAKEICQVGNDELVFHFTDDTSYKFYHDQDCCESVYIEDVCGDLEDLVGSPLTEAELVSHSDANEHEWDIKKYGEDRDNYESRTWSFYKFRTATGTVTVRWVGESNGYYSEGVSLEKIS